MTSRSDHSIIIIQQSPITLYVCKSKYDVVEVKSTACMGINHVYVFYGSEEPLIKTSLSISCNFTIFDFMKYNER